jgi:DNA-binding winged helix-turn-helix (wHTH) protein
MVGFLLSDFLQKNKIMEFKNLLKLFREGSRKYDILKFLIKKRNFVLSKEIVRETFRSPLIDVILESPEGRRIEREKLRHSIYSLNKELKKNGAKIIFSWKKQGYKISQNK